MKTCKGFEIWYKQPVAIQAKQMDSHFSVRTLEGLMEGQPMDYLIIGIKGEKYPCKKEIFEATYTKEKAVPLSEFEAYKQKTKQAIEKHRLDYFPPRKAVESVFYFDKGYLQAIRDLKKELLELD